MNHLQKLGLASLFFWKLEFAVGGLNQAQLDSHYRHHRGLDLLRQSDWG